MKMANVDNRWYWDHCSSVLDLMVHILHVSLVLLLLEVLLEPSYQIAGIGELLIVEVEARDNRSYNSFEEIIDRYIKPMNLLVQDVTSNRKFLDRTVE